MAQISPLIATLKKELKVHNITYVLIAKALNLSEASVKRLFSEESFTLKRLETVCHLMGYEMSDLMLKMNSEQRRISQLTNEQEQEIASDLMLMLVTICVINGLSFSDITTTYNIQHQECIQKLAALDRLKMIALLPKNKIKLLITAHFTWLPNGPIQAFFREKIEQEFFSSRFTKETEQLIVLNGLLSKAGNAVFQKKMQRLASEFTALVQEDIGQPLDQRKGCSVVMAIRDWRYSSFDHLRR